MENLEEHLHKQLGKVKRVSPRPELLEQIEQRLDRPTAPVVFISQQRFAATAAMLLLLNAGILWASLSNTDTTVREETTYSVVSNYNIYSNE